MTLLCTGVGNSLLISSYIQRQWLGIIFKTNIFNQRDWRLVLFFIMAHSDFKMQAHTIILTLKILIYKQAIKIILCAKFVNINTLMRKWLHTQTKKWKLLLQLPVCDFWCTQVKNIHSNTLQTLLSMSWKRNST